MSRIQKPGKVDVRGAVQRAKASLERKAPRLPFDRLEEMLRSGGFEVETGDMGDGSCLWLKATRPGSTEAKLPHDSDGNEVDGAHSVEFCFTPDGKSITDITVAQDVWERTDQKTLLRMEAPNKKR